MLKRIKKYWKIHSSSGQNMTEYIIIVAGVVVTLVVALGPNGLLSRKIGDTMNEAMTGTKCLALKSPCYDPDGCPTECGNDCCEPGESVNDCPEDCSVCTSDAMCDDGIACNGVETCDPATGCQPGGLVCPNCDYGVDFGECAEFWESATVPWDEECKSEERCCGDGGLSGSYTSTTPCTVATPRDCGSVAHDTEARFFESSTVPCGEPCKFEMRKCIDGKFINGSYTATGCNEECADCPRLPGDPRDPPMIPNGTSRIYYLAPQEECWTVCVEEARLCRDGTLEGDPDFSSPDCFVTECNDNVDCTEDICVDNRMTDWGCIFMPHHDWCDDNATCTGADAPGDPWVCGEMCAENGYSDVPGWEIDDDWCDVNSGCVYNKRDYKCDNGYSCSEDYCMPDCAGTCTLPNGSDCRRSNIYCEEENSGLTGCWSQLHHERCDDSVGCTDDSCAPQHTPASDLDAAGCWYDPIDARCDDRVNCTEDYCDLTLDCQVIPHHDRCAKATSCTDDYCMPGCAGTCILPNGNSCADPNVDCQENPRNRGCWSQLVHERCDDGLDCTVDDRCDFLRNCQYTPENDECEDGYPCTTNVCSVGRGCRIVTWNDNECTIPGDLCKIGKCTNDGCTSAAEAEDTVCNDHRACTRDSCNPATGCVYTPLNPAVDCDDGDPCTTDTCEEPGGCKHTCSPSPSCDCSGDCILTPSGVTLKNNTQGYFFKEEKVACGDSCVGKTVRCRDTVPSPAGYSYTGCNQDCPRCGAPEGSDIPFGEGVMFGRDMSCGQLGCDMIQRSCIIDRDTGDLVLTGSDEYKYRERCVEAACDSCLVPNIYGGKDLIKHGEKRTLFSSVGDCCRSQERKCVNGDLDGSDDFDEAKCKATGGYLCDDGVWQFVQYCDTYVQFPRNPGECPSMGYSCPFDAATSGEGRCLPIPCANNRGRCLTWGSPRSAWCECR